MNSSFSDRAGIYGADVQVAASRAGPLAWMIAAGWIVFPFAVQTVLHPADAVWAQYDLQGLDLPQSFTWRQVAAGEIEALFAFGGLVMLQMVCTVLFYRRAQLNAAEVTTPTLWPLAFLGCGILGNSVWFVALTLAGDLNFVGYFVGFSSVALTVGAERLCQRLGRDFVLGLALSGQHPPQTQPW